LAPASSSFFFASSAVSLVDAFLDGLRSAVDQVLGFLQAQAGDFAHGLDHANLVRADFGQNTLNSVFSSAAAAPPAAAATASSSRHAKLLFERLDQVVQFHNGHRANGFRMSSL
jgi:hypothetical protein